MRFLISLTLVLFSPATFAADLGDEIAQLVSAVETSDCTFIRNGKTHSAKEGAAHIQRKYEHFENKIDDLAEFIELTATKSLFTGKPYQVVCQDKSTTSKEWMHQEAQRLGFSG